MKNEYKVLRVHSVNTSQVRFDSKLRSIGVLYAHLTYRIDDNSLKAENIGHIAVKINAASINPKKWNLGRREYLIQFNSAADYLNSGIYMDYDEACKYFDKLIQVPKSQYDLQLPDYVLESDHGQNSF